MIDKCDTFIQWLKVDLRCTLKCQHLFVVMGLFWRYSIVVVSFGEQHQLDLYLAPELRLVTRV